MSGRSSAVALLLATTLVALGGLEGALRVFHYRPALQSGWMLGSSYLTLSDDVIVIPRFLLAPSFYERKDGMPLILTIGDSFTQGYPVDAENTYPAVLERLLEDRGVPVDVANAGVGDSGPDQQLRLLETRLLPRLHPAVVIWSLYANDLWDNVLKAVYTVEGDRLEPLSGAASWISFRQRLFDLALLPEWIKRNSYVFHLVLKATELRSKAALPRAYAGDPTAWGARKLGLELAAFSRLASTHGFKPYVVLIAPQSLYLAPTEPDAWERWWSVVEHRKLAAIVHDRTDVIDAWFGASHSSDIFADGVRDPTLLGERHFNEAGYALLAASVAERLVQDGVFTAVGDGSSTAAAPARH